jgi:predicted RNA-binding Zn-ribbon protein involved in translation (DUF1610 family)
MAKYFYKVDKAAQRDIAVYDGPLSSAQCKYCGSAMAGRSEPVRQMDHHTDEVWFCSNCGWWEYVRREPWTAVAFQGALLEFKNDDETIRSIRGLLEEVATGKKGILQASPREFEKIAYAYFRDAIDGSVELTVQSRDGGFDLWCVDSKIGSFIVEAKRHREKIGLSIVRELLGVMVYNEVKRGVVFHASAMTNDSQKFVTELSKRGEWQIESKSTEDIMSWLRLGARDFDPSFLWTHIRDLCASGDDFAIPRDFFGPVIG